MIIIHNILDVEKYIESVDAVIFDLDDTLYSEKEYVRSGYQKIAEAFGDPELTDKMWQVFLRGGKAIDETVGIDRCEEALKIYRNQIPNIHLYTGVADMLSHIRVTKKIGIVTDGRPEGQWAKIRALNLAVDDIIVTDELGGISYRKPNPLAFQLMSLRLSVPYDRMVYIGDNISKDFIAPEFLGMKSIFFTNSDGLYSCFLQTKGTHIIDF